MNGDSDKLPEDRLRRVHWTVDAESDEDLASRYDQWSDDYDADLEEVDGWAAPRFSAEIMSRYVSPNCRVLDAGAGTGWVGMELARHGFKDIHGIDYSQGMLDRADDKAVYASLRRMNLNDPLELDTDSFDALICVGTLTYVEPDCLREFARVVRPRGWVVFSAQPIVHAERGFETLQQSMEREAIWRRIFVSDEMQPLPRSYPEVRFRTTVLQVL